MRIHLENNIHLYNNAAEAVEDMKHRDYSVDLQTNWEKKLTQGTH